MRVLTIVNVLVWGALLWSGTRLVDGARLQRIGGLPSTGQVAYYICTPGTLVALALVVYVLYRFSRFKRTLVAVQALMLAAVLPFLLPYTGGV